MAVITEKFLKGYQVPAVYVVGGSSMFKEFTTVFEKRLKLPVYRPVHPLLVTPLGIAYHCELPKSKLFPVWSYDSPEGKQPPLNR